jgi:hypothetical protein
MMTYWGLGLGVVVRSGSRFEGVSPNECWHLCAPLAPPRPAAGPRPAPPSGPPGRTLRKKLLLLGKERPSTPGHDSGLSTSTGIWLRDGWG